ncbi:peptidase family C69-domain-containing protein [Emericellopsis atlantica]|uniref:Peptidase family C69-domain-containing protein n=1 Tax=Emericellopsis atlantica TaxID=2614577 RepID=A0A9P7ZUU2_9HYPO|nr:peptidase family C69-domain-containing protein [Emericellopsis atlantica]KAG9258491.1 peptidase family C69-domain-containing protein [Emericellopsis atlantica]
MLPLLGLLGLAAPATASYAFYVGKNLTESGHVLLGGTGEEVSSHWLQLFPAQDHPSNATITVGVTQDASYPGKLITIPQVNHTWRYMSMEYSDFEGFPAPLTNGGLNEKGVAVRDVWASNRDELTEMTPNPQTGVQYSDLARIVMERASTAREGVEIIGDLIKKHGFATYGGNSHLIADKVEGWVVWEFAGGEKLWAAEQLGPDVVRVSYPGYIEEFPVDFAGSRDYMGSENLVDFAVAQGWWDPDGDEPFNVFKAYGVQCDSYHARTGGFKYMSQAALENATLAMVPVTEKDLMKRVRDPRICDDQPGYGQVIRVYEPEDPDLYLIWNAATGSVAAPFVPWYLGVEDVPPEFGQHRYLTTVFAGRVFKRVLYYMCSAPKRFLPLVTDMYTSFEEESAAAATTWVETAAKMLLEAGDRDAARKMLTFFSHTRAYKSLEIGKTLTDALDGYIKLSGVWQTPKGDLINEMGSNERMNCLTGINPDKPADQQ